MTINHLASFYRRPRRYTRQAVTITLLVALLAGLIPPPLARSVLPAPAAALVEAALPQPAVAQAAGTITGIVFQDFNSNGVMNTTGDATNPAIDIGMAGVTVTAYDSTGANVGTTTTRDGAGTPSAGAIGTYSLSASGTGPYRIEFTTLPSGYYPTTHGSDSGAGTAHTGANSGTTVQFVPDGTTANVNLGISQPGDYCQSNPLLCSNAMWFANQITGTYSNQTTLGIFRYTASGKTPAPTTLARAAQVGTTWGLAWQRSNKTLYSAAFLKRHAGFGPNGPGAIYKTTAGADGVLGTGDDVTSLFVDLATLSGVSVGANPHPPGNAGTNCFTASPTLGSTNDWCFDINSYPLVGKMALGDIDLSDDESTLYVMNLADRRLYILPIANPSGFSSVLAPDPGTGATGCPLDAATPAGQLNLNVRPFALKYYNGKVYLGEVCTAQSTQNVAHLRAFVYEYNGTTFTQVLNFPLNFARGSQEDGLSEEWHPWLDTSWPAAIPNVMGANGELFVGYSQPWLTDIEFDRGSMVVGMRDRFGDQSGNIAGSLTLGETQGYTGIGNGDIYRACPNGGTWVVESNGTCGGVTSLTTGPNGIGNGGPGNSQGPGGGEFYYQDNAAAAHLNLGLGGLAQVPGFANVVSTAIDPSIATLSGAGNAPQADLYQSGVTWNNNTTGAKTRGYTTVLPVDGAFAKAGSMGDVEALCDAAPLELGNRLWRDTDNDGIQDPNEPPLANVTVELYQGGVKVGEATTDAYGEYYFGGPNRTNMLVSPTLATITTTVSASSDDAAQTVSSGAVNINNGALNLPYNGTALNLIGMRFASMEIPSGSTINSANLRFTANGTASTTVNLTIRGEAADNAATFANTTNNISSRTTTSANVAWAPGAWTGGATTNATTTDLKTIVQEVVNRAGWSTGNSLAFVISDNSTPSSSNRRVARSFDNSSGGAPLLTVSYYPRYSVQPNTAYEIRVPNASGGSQQAALSGLSLTTQNVGGVSSNDPILDMRDSDGATSGVNAVINYTTGNAGVNNHTLDFGFSTPATGTIQVVKNSLGSDETFTFSSPDSQLDAVSITTVSNTGNSGTPFTKNAGVYTITEDTLTGWSLTGITVTGESLVNSTVDTGARQAVVQLEAGETITVTFVNSQTTVLPCALHPVINQANAVATTSNNSVLGPLNDQATVQINPCVYDYGDLPDGSTSSPTTSPGYNTDITGTVGASHQIVAGLHLGSLVDDETGGQPDSDAQGDDNTDTPDDEDGVTFPTFTAGQSAIITVSVVNTTGNAAVLYGFIDWNGDGTFDDANEVVTQTVNASSAVNLTFSVPANADTTQRLGARFRLSTETALGPDGPADDGEVEDYLISLQGLVSLGNLVWRDTNNNGIYEPGSGESGIDNVVVELRTLAGTLVATDTTSSGGYYLFPDLTPGAYRVTVVGSNFATGQPLFGLVSSTDPVSAANINADTNDDDDGPGTANAAVTSAAITLTVGGEPTTDGDGDANSNLTVDFGFYAPRSELQLSKTLASAAVAKVGDRVIYDLRIENSGEITATQLTLVDQYDPAALTYVTATVAPDLQSSGLITWTGTTAAGSLQPYLPLAPGGVFTVTVEFTAKRP
jgi:uncharacterized repeat protein (TIGR01451 family)